MASADNLRQKLSAISPLCVMTMPGSESPKAIIDGINNSGQLRQAAIPLEVEAPKPSFCKKI